MSELKTSTEEIVVHLVRPGVGAGLPPIRRSNSCGPPASIRNFDDKPGRLRRRYPAGRNPDVA